MLISSKQDICLGTSFPSSLQSSSTTASTRTPKTTFLTATHQKAEKYIITLSGSRTHYLWFFTA